MIQTGLAPLAQLLNDVDYPATRDDLVRLGRRGGLDGESAALLQTLPNRSFNGTWDVYYALENDMAVAS
jgi:hypothetical protein